MEAEVLSNYKSIKVVPAAAADQGEVLQYNETLGFYITEFTAAMLAAAESATLITHAERVKVIKNAGETWIAGEYVYWDAGNSEFTNVEGAATVFCGIITQAALSAAVIGYIMFNGELGSVKGVEITTGSLTFTGTDTDEDTGLTLIQSIICTVKATAQAANDAAYVTLDHGADGLFDSYAWDDAGVAASNACTIYWIATGLK